MSLPSPPFSHARIGFADRTLRVRKRTRVMKETRRDDVARLSPRVRGESPKAKRAGL